MSKNTLTLTLIRGLPGSGKSTLARKLAGEGEGDAPTAVLETDQFFVNISPNRAYVYDPKRPTAVLEADQFFVNISPNRAYVYDPRRAGEAHNNTLSKAMYHLRGGHDVIVSNTFINFWEMEPYVALSDILNTRLVVIDMPLDVNYGNTHGVPVEIVNAMRNNFQPWQGKKNFYKFLDKRFYNV